LGIVILVNDLQKRKQHHSKDRIEDCILTIESASQNSKHSSPSRVTEAGIKTVLRE
jgi:hypothetical protein